jgi:hypothetical protein
VGYAAVEEATALKDRAKARSRRNRRPQRLLTLNLGQEGTATIAEETSRGLLRSGEIKAVSISTPARARIHALLRTDCMNAE